MRTAEKLGIDALLHTTHGCCTDDRSIAGVLALMLPTVKIRYGQGRASEGRSH